jgi:hypothetical protein
MLLVFLHVQVLLGSGFCHYFLNRKAEAEESAKHWSKQAAILMNYSVSARM